MDNKDPIVWIRIVQISIFVMILLIPLALYWMGKGITKKYCQENPEDAVKCGCTKWLCGYSDGIEIEAETPCIQNIADVNLTSSKCLMTKPV